MIELRHGNLLDADAEALVNAVNCVGVMGKGLALQFKKAYPENFRLYALACREGKVRPGRMFVAPSGRNANPRYLINFPTKRHHREPSYLEDIESGLVALVEMVANLGIDSLAYRPWAAVSAAWIGRGCAR
jgi:O-acetyl-ADP-ribose deacetylase (regulator of RNase III)